MSETLIATVQRTFSLPAELSETQRQAVKTACKSVWTEIG